MNKKNKIKKSKKLNKKIKAVFSESQVGALVENFNDNLKIISENQINTNERLDRLESRFDGLEADSKSFKEETRENFKLVFEHFSNIEDELNDIKLKLEKMDKNKIDKKEFNLLKVRVGKLEKKLERMKVKSKC